MIHVAGIAIQTLGTVFIAYAALSVHHRFLKEHKVDEKVFLTMRVEQVLGVIGVLLFLLGSTLEIVAVV